jgi:glycerol-3-phosphate dehydrogenase (NAD(P)+)
MVVEGVFAAQSAHEQAQRLGIDCPVIEQVHAVLFEGRDVADALQNLMMRSPKPEHPAG